MLTSHVFFRLNTLANMANMANIISVLQRTMINLGALLRLMYLEITLRKNGETVTGTVEKSLQQAPPVVLQRHQLDHHPKDLL